MSNARRPTPLTQPSLALGIPLAAAGLAAGIVLLSARGYHPTPAPHAAQLWSARRAAAVQRVTAHPGDLEAQLVLSRVLTKEAAAEAQEAYAALPRSRRGAYRPFIAARLRGSSELADAEALAQHVATKGEDAHLRARALSHLAGLSQIQDERAERMRWMRQAAREDPAQFEAILRACERSETAVPSRAPSATAAPLR
jgi:hypothetical protein